MPGKPRSAIPLIFRTSDRTKAFNVFVRVGAALTSRVCSCLIAIEQEGGPLSAIARAARGSGLETSEMIRKVAEANRRVEEWHTRLFEPEDEAATAAPIDITVDDYTRFSVRCQGSILVELIVVRFGKSVVLISQDGVPVDVPGDLQLELAAEMYAAAAKADACFMPLTAQGRDGLYDMQELLEGVRLR